MTVEEPFDQRVRAGRANLEHGGQNAIVEVLDRLVAEFGGCLKQAVQSGDGADAWLHRDQKQVRGDERVVGCPPTSSSRRRTSTALRIPRRRGRSSPNGFGTCSLEDVDLAEEQQSQVKVFAEARLAYVGLIERAVEAVVCCHLTSIGNRCG